MLIIGYGNTDRGDDAAGILVARRLRDLGVDAIEHLGDGCALLDLWAAADGFADEVVVIDAMVSGKPLGSVRVWDARELRAAEPALRTSTHRFGLGQAVELARVLGQLPARLTIYGIEGLRFEPGAEPSLEVLRAVERVALELFRKSAAVVSLGETAS